ncbi:MAG: hypothetical protein ACQESA_02000 [Patescibacteria group bacterium]
MNKVAFVLSIVLFVALVIGAKTYVNWYSSLPVVKVTPDNSVVAVKDGDQYFGPEYIEKREVRRYKKEWVSFDWKPPK